MTRGVIANHVSGGTLGIVSLFSQHRLLDHEGIRREVVRHEDLHMQRLSCVLIQALGMGCERTLPNIFKKLYRVDHIDYTF